MCCFLDTICYSLVVNGFCLLGFEVPGQLQAVTLEIVLVLIVVNKDKADFKAVVGTGFDTFGFSEQEVEQALVLKIRMEVFQFIQCFFVDDSLPDIRKPFIKIGQELNFDKFGQVIIAVISAYIHNSGACIQEDGADIECTAIFQLEFFGDGVARLQVADCNSDTRIGSQIESTSCESLLMLGSIAEVSERTSAD